MWLNPQYQKSFILRLKLTAIAVSPKILSIENRDKTSGDKKILNSSYSAFLKNLV